MANEFTNDIPHMAEELRSTMDDLSGVVYVLNVMSDTQAESKDALRNQARIVDECFAQLDLIADALEEMK